MTDHDLKNAYSIDGPEAAKTLYKSWAKTYDAGFGAAHGYDAPRQIAEIFLSENKGDTPLLDVGAGTGLVAEHLAGTPVDAFDISPEMLEVARPKDLYRNLLVGDLLEPLPFADHAYGGVISAGTFTHGHVGPACLPELLRVTRPGGLFVCGSVPAVMDGMGFGSTLARLQSRGQISPLRFVEIDLYTNKDHAHGHDTGLVMIFRKI